MNLNILRHSTPLPTPDEMNAWDEAATHRIGLTPEMLMENASREAFSALAELLADRLPCGVEQAGVAIFAGPGNNGGDAIALARHLKETGAQVRLYLTRSAESYTEAADFHLDVARRCGVVPETLDEAVFARSAPDVVVDGLLGTGLSGELRPDMHSVIERLNRWAARSMVVALDIPSGLSGHTGEPLPVAVRADATITFEAAKVGLVTGEAGAYTGQLIVRPIGIPALIRNTLPPACRVLTPSILQLARPAGPAMHKGDAGRVLIAGGSPGREGAAVLSAVGAMRAGAGYVYLAGPAGVMQRAAHLPEVLCLQVGDKWVGRLGRELLEAGPYSAIATGPGLGTSGGARAFLHDLLEEWSGPLVIDADGLNLLADYDDLRRLLSDHHVLTPHPGEAARLLGTTADEVQADRAGAIRRLVEQTGATVVLKGAGTLINAPQMPTLLCPVAAPSLAVAGSGDVLTGMICALLARGLDAIEAACLGVFAHGRAGLDLLDEFPCRGNTAMDIAERLPAVFRDGDF